MNRSMAAARQVLAVMGALVLVAALAFVFASTTAAAPTLPDKDAVVPEHPTGTMTWQGSRTPYPHMTGTPTPRMTGTPWNWGTRTPYPHMTGTPMMGTRTPYPNMTGTPMPHMTGTPMMGTRTPMPHMTGTPYPHMTRTPNPNMTGTRTPYPHMTGTPMMGTRTPYPNMTRTPMGTRTPLPWMRPMMALRPQVQFGIAPPGGEAEYTKALLNRFEQATLVGLTGTSIAGWDVTLDPTAIIVQPGVSETIDITVNVPLSPTLPFDVEGVIAISAGPTPYTARAYMVTIVHRTPFGDMSSSHWADGPVQYLAAKGAISGYPDGTFRPDANVTRAQVAKMVVGAMAWETVSPQQPTFSDVSAGHWAYAYVETAAAHDIINGYLDGTFRPDANVTRAQVAKMVSLARGWAMELPATGTFTDAGPADWYFAYAEMTAAAGVMSGYPDGTFRPNAPATRAQVAKILGLGTLSEPNQ